MSNVDCQVSAVEKLKDVGRNGKERPWARHKLANGYLAIAYDEIDTSKATRLRACASWLDFVRVEGVLKLHNANFCRVRLCPICAWRRALKTYGQVYSITSNLVNDYQFVFVTLTLRNVKGDCLASTLDDMSRAYSRMMGYKAVKQAYKGYYRALEITHNLNDDTYHPHYHCIMAVRKSYWTSRDYLKQADIVSYWRKAMRLSYDPVCDIRRIKSNNIEGICAEVAKYTVKTGDIICFDDWELTVDTVRLLDKALDKRRFVGFGGCMADMHRQLHLDDVDNGDLIHTAHDEDLPDLSLDHVMYAWHTGYAQYVRD